MQQGTVFAVIDLETTGTAVKTGDRMIQFGCALVKNGKVIQTVSQLVNPDRPVPEPIQQLTGIKPKDLVSAPYFEELAASLRGLLDGCVIVAHNVNFDLPFLNAELERVGEKPLVAEAIDTVELAQILLPTLASYRLSDLTSYLHITHENPHRADSDAISTAHLLLALAGRFQALPTQTQTLLITLSPLLIQSTGKFLASLKQQTPLAGNQELVGQFVLRQKMAPIGPITPHAKQYPATSKAKKALLRPELKLRSGQAKMMDAIYQNATDTKMPLFIEAGTGLGKSLGYLLPYAYLADARHQLVVSTSTTVLQTQLAESTMPLVQRLCDIPLDAVILKSPQHFISLAKFAASLHSQEPNRLTRLLQMKLIVWLTQTTSGDFDELHMTNLNAPLFGKIRATGEPEEQGDPYSAVDFYPQLMARAKDAQILITNHAYLTRHLPFAGQSKPYLVVDEAQHFADNAASAFSQKLGLSKLRRQLSQLNALVGRTEKRSLLAIYTGDQLMSYQLQVLQGMLEQSGNLIENLQHQLYRRFFAGMKAQSGFLTRSLNAAEVAWLLKALAPRLQQLEPLLTRISHAIAQCTSDFEQHEAHFLLGDAAVFQAADALAAAIDRQLAAMNALDLDAIAAGEAGVTSLTLANINDVFSLNLQWEVYDVSSALQTLLQKFSCPVFVGATLMVARKFDFLAKQLGYQDLDAIKQEHFRSPFHYRNQAQVLIAKDAPAASDTSADGYADYLARAISRLADDPHQTIALFTSLDTIRQVYYRLSQLPIAGHQEILAQGVTGSAQKIAKRFAVSQNALLLGAASFFEGIDYPDKALERVILTRLPFDSPERPVVKARAAQLAAAGEDPFTQDALPRATLRFRQSFGRLIRTENDRGVFIILDPRIQTTRYGQKMQKALPNLKPLSLSLKAIDQYSKAWLNHEPMADIEKEDEHA